MSLSRRDSPFANAGTVMTIDEAEVQTYKNSGPLRGLEYQKEIEQLIFQHGDGSQKAPALRITDFIEKRLSKSLPTTSYIPGIYPAQLQRLLPEKFVFALSAAIRNFDKAMKGYLNEDAILVATESRSSSPVRIPRVDSTKMHPDIQGLYPAGEGAGYAGGIVSAALDGILIAKQAVETLSKT